MGKLLTITALILTAGVTTGCNQCMQGSYYDPCGGVIYGPSVTPPSFLSGLGKNKHDKHSERQWCMFLRPCSRNTTPDPDELRSRFRTTHAGTERPLSQLRLPVATKLCCRMLSPSTQTELSRRTSSFGLQLRNANRQLRTVLPL